MSIHSSLRGIDTLKGERSVFSRIERLAILRKEGKFNDQSSSVYGLPKVRTRFKVAGGAKKKAKEDAAAAAAAKPGATVAAGATATPAKGAEKAGDKKAADKKAPAAAAKDGKKK